MGSDDPILVSRKRLTDPSSPFLRRLLNLAVNGEDEHEEIENGVRVKLRGDNGIRELLGQVYYSFPCTQDTYNHLSRFLLGQSLIINQLGNGSEIRSFVGYNDYHITFAFMNIANGKACLVIFNIKERGWQGENV